MDKKQRIGRYIKCSSGADEPYKAYVPQDIPPNPPITIEDLYFLLDQASTALGRLDGMSMVLPDRALFLYMYIRKEAVLTSQIEGTQSSLSDLLLFENEQVPGVPMDDANEASCYVAAINYGLDRLNELPLSLRLIREIHQKLMAGGRGRDKLPGEFRSSQNWVGGTRPENAYFVPPPPTHLMPILDNFEKFLHDKTIKLPILIKAAIAHVQFETIHPFLDGNGRIGRLLITLMLCAEGILRQPLLYLSLYFKTHRQTYYDHLQSVRETGEWEEWIKFFLKGVTETANQAMETAQAIINLLDTDRIKIEQSNKAATTAVTLHLYFQKHPISTTARIKKSIKVSLPTILRALEALEKLGIIKEITGKGRHKVFVYKTYLDILNKGTVNPIKV